MTDQNSQKPGLTGPTGRESVFGLNFFNINMMMVVIKVFILFRI
jgi:hypothetical protein